MVRVLVLVLVLVVLPDTPASAPRARPKAAATGDGTGVSTKRNSGAACDTLEICISQNKMLPNAKATSKVVSPGCSQRIKRVSEFEFDMD